MRARILPLVVAAFALALGRPAVAAAAPAKPARAAKVGVIASVDRSRIPGGGPTPALVLPKATRFTLASGATVLVVERHGLPMASVSVVWPVGAAAESVSDAGLAVLTADLLDEGTTSHGALALAETLEGLGASIEAGSGWDSSGVALVTLTKNLDPALALLAEVVGSPAFEDKELERLRSDHLTALLQRKDAPSVVATDVFTASLYGAAARYGTPLIGTETSLKHLRRDDVVRFYRSHFRPKNATIIVAGDVTPDAVKTRLEAAFAHWTEPAEPAAAPPLATGGPASPPARHLVVVDKPGAPQSELRMGLPSVPRKSPDYFGLLVMNEILGGGEFSNRLNLNLREAHAYTYGAHSGFAFRKQGGPFVVSTATKTAVTGPAVMEAFGEILRIRSVPVSPAELRLAKDELERAMARRFATLGDVTSELAEQVVFDLPDDFLATFAARVEAVTPEEVLRVAIAHLDPAQLSIVLVGDKSAVTPQLGGLPVGAFEEADAAGKLLAPKK